MDSEPHNQSPAPWADLARLIKSRRALLALSQRQAADLSDLSEKALRDIESGRVAPRLGALLAIAETLGLDLALIPRETRGPMPPEAVVLHRADDHSDDQ
jgi:transcriptional regulator with XRE-family HTH domain